MSIALVMPVTAQAQTPSDVQDLVGARAAGDLVGARGSSADDEMRRRGFTNVGNERSGTSSYSIWYSRSTHQCLQMGTANGRVQNLVDIGSYPGCR